MRRGRVGPTVLLAVLLAGCGSDARPNYSSVPVTAAPTTAHTPPSGPGSSPAAPSSSEASATTPITTGPNVRPGEVPPTVSSSAMQHSAIGAAFYAAYWMQTLDWAYATMDTTLLKAAFIDICSECSRPVIALDKLRDGGGHVNGGRIAVKKWIVAENDSRNGAEQASDVTVDIGAEQTIDSTGSITGSENVYDNDTYRVWTVWQSSGWKVVAWKEVVN